MFSKEFLQGRVKTLLHDYIKDELFPTSVGLVMPTSKTGTRTKTWYITALVTKLSQEDKSRFSVENMEYRTVDLFKEDLDKLKSDNPSAYIRTKNLQKNTQISINGKTFKISEEKDTEGFEEMIRLICERKVM